MASCSAVSPSCEKRSLAGDHDPAPGTETPRLSLALLPSFLHTYLPTRTTGTVPTPALVSAARTPGQARVCAQMCHAVGAGKPQRGQPREGGDQCCSRYWLHSRNTHPVLGVDIHPTVDEVLHNVRVPSPGGHVEGGAEQLEEGEGGYQRGSASTPANPTQDQPWFPGHAQAPGTACAPPALHTLSFRLRSAPRS